MNPTFSKYDRIGHGLDTALFIGLGIAMIIIGLYRIHKKVKSGEYNEEKGKSQIKKTWLCGCLLIGAGIFRIFFG
jgi:uncharacterized membrane protein YfcA